MVNDLRTEEHKDMRGSMLLLAVTLLSVLCIASVSAETSPSEADGSTGRDSSEFFKSLLAENGPLSRFLHISSTPLPSEDIAQVSLSFPCFLFLSLSNLCFFSPSLLFSLVY